jgi:hypothetical protein
MVEAATKKLSNNAPPGSLDYLKIYPKAISRVLQKLTDQQYIDLQVAVDRYNSVGPPDNVKAA